MDKVRKWIETVIDVVASRCGRGRRPCYALRAVGLVLVLAIASQAMAEPPLNSRDFRAALDTLARRSHTERAANEEALLRHYATLVRWYADARRSNADELSLESARTGMRAAESWALNGREPMQPFYAAPMRIAAKEILVFRDETLTVSRVLDARRAVVTWAIVEHRGGYYAGVRNGRPANYRPARRRTIETAFVVDGVETYRLAPGEQYTGPRALYVSRTVDVRSNGVGARSLPRLVPVDLAPHEERFTKWGQARAWRRADGELLARSVLAGVANDHVALVDRHGVRRTIAIDDLSESDRDHIKEWRLANDPVLLAAD